MTMENDLVELIQQRIGSEFDGEANFTEVEADMIIKRIQALEAELAQTKKERDRYLGMLEAAENLSLALGIDTHGAAVDVAVRFLKEKRIVEAELARKTEALEIIAGVRPCIDNLMGNDDIARSALEEKTDV